MNPHLISTFALVLSTFAQADPDIRPDWNKLTDFTASMKVDLAAEIEFFNNKTDYVYKKEVLYFKRRCEACPTQPAYDGDEYPTMCKKDYCHKGDADDCPMLPCRQNHYPFKALKSSSTVQLDLLGERFKIASTGFVEYSDQNQGPNVPPALRGATVTGRGLFAFDAKEGFVVVKETATITSPLGPGSYEFCAKVHFPKGLLPPAQVIKAQLDHIKPQVQHVLNGFPWMGVRVDGNDVALFEKPGHLFAGWDGKTQDFVIQEVPNMFGGIMFDATPVGFGVAPPAGGQWNDASILFSSWTAGAGTIEDEPCLSVSATELLQNPHANRTLWAFDRIMSHLKSTEPLSTVLAFVPGTPSQIFASAARLEHPEVSAPQLSENAEVVSSASSWATMAMAAAGGVVGASIVLVLSKSSRASWREHALLG